MKNEKELKAGVVGLGLIGGGIATSLVNSGRIPAVFDIIPDAYKKHANVPAQLGSCADVAEKSDVIMVAVFNAEQVKEVLTGENGLLSRSHEGMVVVLLSTVTMQEAKEFAALCAEKEVGFLDCGVTPGSLAAKNGLVAMVGGDEKTFEYAIPVLADWSADAIYCGPAGTGMAVKIARNVNTYGIWRVVVESTRLANAVGVTPDRFLKVLEAADKTENLFYNVLRKIATSPDGKVPSNMANILLKYMLKDLDASTELSKTFDVDMPIRDAVKKLVNDTVDLR